MKDELKKKQNKCNHLISSFQSGANWCITSHTLPDGMRWIRCSRCGKIWKNVAGTSLHPPDEPWNEDLLKQEDHLKIFTNPVKYTIGFAVSEAPVVVQSPKTEDIRIGVLETERRIKDG